jgi:hypothetical protein
MTSKTFGFAALLAGALALAACAPKAAAPAEPVAPVAEEPEMDAPQAVVAVVGGDFRPASGGEGILQGVLTIEGEDYPRYSAILTPAAGDEAVELYIDDSEADSVGDGIASLNGKAVLAYYTVDGDNRLGALTAEGKELLDPNPYFEAETEIRSITGVLTGVNPPTQGDLPSLITVTAPDGQSVEFEYFVYDPLPDYEGKTVTARYVFETRNGVTWVRELAQQ